MPSCLIQKSSLCSREGVLSDGLLVWSYIFSKILTYIDKIEWSGELKCLYRSCWTPLLFFDTNWTLRICFLYKCLKVVSRISKTFFKWIYFSSREHWNLIKISSGGIYCMYIYKKRKLFFFMYAYAIYLHKPSEPLD